MQCPLGKRRERGGDHGVAEQLGPGVLVEHAPLDVHSGPVQPVRAGSRGGTRVRRARVGERPAADVVGAGVLHGRGEGVGEVEHLLLDEQGDVEGVEVRRRRVLAQGERRPVLDQ
ncbi:PRC-barrel domain-containing protein [Streptomyces sp. NPDC004296]|uniref:PRC-barrel domain-containing protein n=1 Tax=Streptomyces sp. NPDC004296 TaxID=3364697 RepID=UPI003677FE7B